MKSFCLYCFAALTAGAVLVSYGMTDETTDPFGDDLPPGVDVDETPDPFGQSFDSEDVSQGVVEVPGPRSEIEDLRAKYLEAARQRAEMMDEEALREAVESEEKSVAELRARQALKKVEQELERIGDEYSDTIAGRNAVLIFNELQKLNRNGLKSDRPGDLFRDTRFDDSPDFLPEPQRDDAFDDAPDAKVIPDLSEGPYRTVPEGRETPFRPSTPRER